MTWKMAQQFKWNLFLEVGRGELNNICAGVHGKKGAGKTLQSTINWRVDRWMAGQEQDINWQRGI